MSRKFPAAIERTCRSIPEARWVAAAAAQGSSLAALSRLLRRNGAYLQQYVARGSPRELSERDRRLLADYLAVPEEALGAAPRPRDVAVRRLDVAASAGPGALSDDDRVTGVEHFPSAMLRRHGLDGRALSMIVARGTSMEPTIGDGDEMLVDTGDRRLAGGGIFVFRHAGAIGVKRLALRAGKIAVESDNPEVPPIAPLPIDEVEVIGRIVWLSRRLR